MADGVKKERKGGREKESVRSRTGPERKNDANEGGVNYLKVEFLQKIKTVGP